MMQSSLPVAPGSMLAGKYRIDRVLGEGGMGVVVAATHMELEQKVAIKFLLPAALANAEVVSRFSREARAAARIRGEHVARVIDVGALETGAPYIVMEYLEGKDLSEVLAERGPLPVVDTVWYVLQACEALAEAHAAGIVHRDIKPANLFLAATPDRSHIIKVLDFGISKSMDPNSASGSLTRTSAVLGSAFYLSPEQLISAKTVDQRADIWALGIVLYQLLSGRVPFDGESMPEVIAHILKNRPVPLRQMRADVPDQLAAIIGHCLRESPHERFLSVLELAEALAPYGGEHARISVDKIRRVLGGATGNTTRSPLAASLGLGGRAAPPLPLPTGATNIPSVITEPNAYGTEPSRHPVGDRTNMPWIAPPNAPPHASSQRWLYAIVILMAMAVAGVAMTAIVLVVRSRTGPVGASSGGASATTTVSVTTPPSATTIPELDRQPADRPTADRQPVPSASVVTSAMTATTTTTTATTSTSRTHRTPPASSSSPAATAPSASGWSLEMKPKP
jgi:eukaryotic-like serine/threonine-protein kinase